jgi:hypothetical protein
LDNLAVSDLPRAAFAAQLPRDFDLMIPRHDVSLGEEAPVGIHRQFAAYFDAAVLGERGGFASLTKTEALERDPGENRKRVVRATCQA